MKLIICLCLLALTWHFCSGMLTALVGAVGSALFFTCLIAYSLLAHGVHWLIG